MRVLLALGLVLALPGASWAGLLDLAPLAELAAQKVKEVKAATLVDAEATIAGGFVLPVMVLHTRATADRPAVDLAEFDIGVVLKEGGQKKALASMLVNLPGALNRITQSEWFSSRLRTTPLPPLFFGPYIGVPFPSETWLLRREVGGMLSLRLN